MASGRRGTTVPRLPAASAQAEKSKTRKPVIPEFHSNPDPAVLLKPCTLRKTTIRAPTQMQTIALAWKIRDF